MQALGHSLSDRRLQVLRALGECGSISQAARAVGVSYKAAWQAIDTLSNLAGVPVVAKSVGGAGGGGATLTAAGQELLRAAQAMALARGAVMQQLQAHSPAAAVQRLGIQTSMRNQWPCVVQQVEVAGPLALVQVQSLHGDVQLTARITAESAQLLGLQAGMAVLAMCKATAVQVVAEMRRHRLQALLATHCRARLHASPRVPLAMRWRYTWRPACSGWALRWQAVVCVLGAKCGCTCRNLRWCWPWRRRRWTLINIKPLSHIGGDSVQLQKEG